MRQFVYQVCYTRYHILFYLWLIGSVLKHSKVPKYYDQDCRLSNLSSNPKVFREPSKHYQNILNQFGHDHKLQFKWPINKNENKSKSSKNCKRNIIWFNPSFSKEVSNNIGKYFLPLTLSVLEETKSSIFEISAITPTLSINN